MQATLTFTTVICLLLFGISPSCAEQVDFDYAPRFAPTTVHALTPQPCSLSDGANFVLHTDEVIAADCGGDAIRISGIHLGQKTADEITSTHVLIALRRKQLAPFLMRLPLTKFPAAFVDAVSFADLNGDEKPDFIIDLSAHGNGLAAEVGGVLLLLSNTRGYQYLTLPEVMHNTPRFMQLSANGAVIMVLQRLVAAQSTVMRNWSGKQHTYFVFDLLRFDARVGKGMALANSLDSRFPFWTLYTNAPSHRATKLLTAAQQKAAWRNPLAAITTGAMLEKPNPANQNYHRIKLKQDEKHD